MVRIEFRGADLEEVLLRISAFLKKSVDEKTRMVALERDPITGHTPGYCSICGKYKTRVRVHEAFCRKRHTGGKIEATPPKPRQAQAAEPPKEFDGELPMGIK